MKLFTVKNVDIEVEYNQNIWSHNDIVSMLNRGVKSLNKFYEMEEDFDILNGTEVFHKLFFNGAPIVKKVMLANYVGFCNWMGRDLKEMLFLSFGIEIVNCIDEDNYVLKGSKKGFSLLKDFL